MMEQNSFSHVRIAGIASAVPVNTVDNSKDLEQFAKEELAKIIASTGVASRHVATAKQCTSDLCYQAALTLLAELNWSPKSVDILIFVSQTPDYVLPATSCVLHGRLGLAKHCVAFDVNLGCSGYVYALWQAVCFLSAGAAKRVLLLVGDTITKVSSPEDRSVALLFGDAGTATAVEYHNNAAPMYFELGTDGQGYDKLIVSAGSFRQPSTAEAQKRSLREQNNIRSDADLYMNGAEIFAFTLREVPELIQKVLNKAAWSIDQVDALVLHQANQFMLTHIAKRLKIPEEKLPLSLMHYGNTSSASIPLTLNLRYSGEVRDQPLQLLLIGFGVGFSWAGAAVTLDSDCKLLPIMEVL